MQGFKVHQARAGILLAAAFGISSCGGVSGGWDNEASGIGRSILGGNSNEVSTLYGTSPE